MQVFALNQKAFTAKQSCKTLSEYYGELTEVFRELDHRDDKVVMTDPEDIVAYKKSIERLRIHIFFAGLNGEFEQIRGEIQRKEPVLDLEGCYFLVRRETVHHATLNGEYGDPEASAMVTRPGNPEASAMVARHRFNQNWQNHLKTNNGSDKSTYKCIQCNQTSHTKSRCFELVGYLEWWDHNHDTLKKNSKRPSTVAIAETKSEGDIAEKGSALMLTANNGGKV